MKGLGVFATLLGAFFGGLLMTRSGLVRSLLIFGVLQAVSNLGFVALAMVGKNPTVLTAVIVIENVTGGMGTAAFVALVMSLCDPRYTATQFALLSSLEALGRVFAGRPSADVVTLVGWTQFFVLTVVVAFRVFGPFGGSGTPLSPNGRTTRTFRLEAGSVSGV